MAEEIKDVKVAEPKQKISVDLEVAVRRVLGRADDVRDAVARVVGGLRAS